MNIADLITGNRREGYEGEPWSMLVLHLRKARTAQAQVKVELRAMHELQVSIVFLSKLHEHAVVLRNEYN